MARRSVQAFGLAYLAYSGRIQLWHMVVLAFLSGTAIAVEVTGNIKTSAGQMFFAKVAAFLVSIVFALIIRDKDAEASMRPQTDLDVEPEAEVPAVDRGKPHPAGAGHPQDVAVRHQHHVAPSPVRIQPDDSTSERHGTRTTVSAATRMRSPSR